MMSPAGPFLTASEAARRLGVSAKTLRLYEQRGLLSPDRSAAGYRLYGPAAMARAAEVAALRALGLSLAQVAQVLAGDPQSLAPALAAHEAVLEADLGALAERIGRVRALRAGLARGETPAAGDLPRLLRPAAGLDVSFALPWPWGGERFALHDVQPLTYIVGPLGSGKTRLARCLAESLPDAAFLGLERLEDEGAASSGRLEGDAALRARVERTLAWLVGDGATPSNALLALLVALESEAPAVLVVDMVEQGLDRVMQEALAGHFRRRAAVGARPLFLMTRSTAILDLAAVGPGESILLCPANHSPPSLVAPYPGAPGYEAVATCLAAPDVRARTAGVIALAPTRTA